MRSNEDFRNAAKEAKIPLWRIADQLNFSEATMMRKLRRPLVEPEKSRFFAALQEIIDEERSA